MDLNKALSLVDISLALLETFRNNCVKAQILDKLRKFSVALEFDLKDQSLVGSDPSYQFFIDGNERGITDIKAK